MPCNIGIALDSNNIPVIWKNRDRSTEFYNDAQSRSSWIYLKNNDTDHDILSISSSEYKNRYMAINDKGLVVVNSTVDIQGNDDFDDTDLPNDVIIKNDDLLTDVLLHCESIDCFFDRISIMPSSQLQRDISSNYAVIDSEGNGAIIEVYADPDTVISSSTFLSDSNQFFVRTNHFILLNHLNPVSSEATSSYDRYNNAYNIVGELTLQNDFEFDDLFVIEDVTDMPLLRNFFIDEIPVDNTQFSDPGVPNYNNSLYEGVPYGYFDTNKSTNRFKTVSSLVALGSNPSRANGESIVWINLGNPITSPFLPIKISDFITYQNSIDDGTLSNNYEIAFSDYSNDHTPSQFSIQTQIMRENIFNYDDSYVNSFLLEPIASILNSIEQDFILTYLNDDDSTRINKIFGAFNQMQQFYDSYDGGFCFDEEFGDFNCDYEVTIVDLIIVINIALNHPVATDSQLYIIDNDGDGDITIFDIIYLISQILNA